MTWWFLVIAVGYGLTFWSFEHFSWRRIIRMAEPTPQERAAERDQRIAELERELGIGP